MNAEKKQSSFDNFLESYLRELMAMPDEEVLAGADRKTIKDDALALLKSARAEAGRRRLAAARKRLAASKRLPEIAVVSAAEARVFLRQAANDARYTLAARELGEMSDEDVIQLYIQLKQLEAISKEEDGHR
jgi:hypothetical protein